MKIEAAEIRYVELPLISPWRTAYGEDAAIHSVLVQLTGGGESAWGESTPLKGGSTRASEPTSRPIWLVPDWRRLPQGVDFCLSSIDR